ncbi:hypothetical protein NPS46_05255 [Pseudomonas putida]|uniref:hypothetical protein n=1 Tax=Pseudomonas putida TaxID=303 RepID=UPI002363B73F|nr:hypothetical protein [Pseudomonas putida]MDD2051959.1 hypothetical protein [Pseudomonas putida]
MRWSDFPGWLKVIILLGVFSLFASALFKYPGTGLYYVWLSVVANGLLYFGFRDQAIFFDTFIGVFFWLGFWMKFSYRLVFMDGDFIDSGHFDFSPAAFDQAVLVAVCGLSGLLLASYLRGKYIFNYPKECIVDTLPGLFNFYVSHRKFILFIFLAFVLVVGVANIYLGVYQRGEITRTVLPFGLNRIVAWLLLFGLASFVAVFLNFEFRLKRNSYFLVVLYSFLEGAISSISLLSRGMVLNTGSMLYGVIYQLRIGGMKVRAAVAVFVLVVFAALFFGSAVGVTYARTYSYTVNLEKVDAVAQPRAEKIVSSPGEGPKDVKVEHTTPTMAQHVVALFLDRWVGMDGVMAVSSYPGLGWELWTKAWAEAYNENVLSFYDSNIINSAYNNEQSANFHFVSLSGIVAFFFYPGSYCFLFFAMFSLGVGAALVEIFVYKFGGRNVVLCSLFGQIVAYRFMSFGYVPAQSYLLFGSIMLNVLLIYYVDMILSFGRARLAS